MRYSTIAAVSVMVLAAGSAMAGRVRIEASYGQGTAAGEYRAVVLAGNLGSSDRFQTFCVERSEFLGLGQTYNAAVSNEVRYNNQGVATPLTAGVAYLYTLFRQGNLADYNYADNVAGSNRFASRRDSSVALQEAIWMLQGQMQARNSNYYLTMARTAIAQGGWSGLGNVRVLNLTGGRHANGAGNNQDVLTLVPLPGAAATAMAGLLGVAAFRRRR